MLRYYEDLRTLNLPMNYALRRAKAAKKYLKYKDIPRALVSSLKVKISKKLSIDWESIQASGEYEVLYQMNRLYGLDRTETLYPMSDEDFTKLFKKLYDPESKDLRVGPFFLKGLSKSKGHYSPYINGHESGTLKRVKIAILRELRSQDIVSHRARADARAYKDLNYEYQNTLLTNKLVPDSVVMKNLHWGKARLDRAKEVAGLSHADYDDLENLLGMIDTELEKYMDKN